MLTEEASAFHKPIPSLIVDSDYNTFGTDLHDFVLNAIDRFVDITNGRLVDTSRGKPS